MGEINSFPINTNTFSDLDELHGEDVSASDKYLIYDQSQGIVKSIDVSETRKYAPFIYETVAQLVSSDIPADTVNPFYVKVEETGYRLYKIINTAPEAGDILLDNGNVAVLQEEYQLAGFVQGPADSSNNAVAVFDGEDSDKIKPGPIIGDIGESLIAANTVSDTSFIKINPDSSVVMRNTAQMQDDLGIDERVVGPASSANEQIALFDGTTGKILKAGQTLSQYFASYLDDFLVTLYNIFPRKINTYADLASTPASPGQLFYLSEYSPGSGIGGHLLGESGVVTPDNKNTFPSGTAGVYLRRINQSFIDSRMGGVSDNALPPGAVLALEYIRDGYIGNSSGNSDIRNFLIRSQLNGAYGADQMITQSFQSEFRHTAGTITFAYGIQGFSRLGRLGSSTGNITSSRGIEWHTANEGSGTIDVAYNFYSQDLDLLDGTGTVGQMVGFRCANQSHSSRVTNSALGFDCEDFVNGAPALTAAFRSQMTDGTNKWAFLGAGNAPSAFAGKVRIGDADKPTDALEVRGYAKITRNGTKTVTGNYHEIHSDNTDYVAHVRNSAASNAHGIRIRFTGSAPNNTTQEFIRCEDTVGARILVYSNGNVVNQNNSYGAISDERLKENIADAPSVLDKFRLRKFKTYSLKSDESAQMILGVIAQDELKISPDLVTEKYDGYLSYNYAGLAVESAQAVGELLKIIDKMQSKIDALEKLTLQKN